MKKKLAVMLLASVIILGFATQDYTSAEAQIPRITSIKSPTFIALNN
ncbi:hypothetical protein MHH33_04855 [Paenisporosarcina sp. FSL H8-0542]